MKTQLLTEKQLELYNKIREHLGQLHKQWQEDPMHDQYAVKKHIAEILGIEFIKQPNK